MPAVGWIAIGYHCLVECLVAQARGIGMSAVEEFDRGVSAGAREGTTRDGWPALMSEVLAGPTLEDRAGRVSNEKGVRDGIGHAVPGSCACDRWIKETTGVVVVAIEVADVGGREWWGASE